MRNIKYYPLICADTENGDMMTLFSTENRVTMEQHHKLYLSEIEPYVNADRQQPSAALLLPRLQRKGVTLCTLQTIIR